MRRAGLALAAVTGALAVAGCGGTTGAGTSAAELIPAGAPAFISMDTDLDSAQWKTVLRLADRFPDKDKAVRSAKRELLQEEGLDWEKDVKPAMGPEFDLVWLDLSGGGDNFVGLVQPRDGDALKRLLERTDRKDPDNNAFYEQVDGWYVIAERQALIDRFKREREDADRRLADDRSFKQAMGRFSSDSLARAWVSGAEIMDAIRRYGDDADVDRFIAKLGTLDWIATSLRARDQGIRLDAAIHGTPGSMLKGKGTGTFAPKLPSRTPQDALLYWTFHGSAGMFAGLTENPVLQTSEARPFTQILQQFGKLLAGENALYVRPGPGRLPEVTLVTEPQRGTNGAATLDRIVHRFRKDLGAKPRPTTVAGKPARALDFGDFALRYANVGGKLVITDLPEGIAGVAGGGKKLSTSEDYRNALSAAGVPASNQGFLYVDVHSSVGLVEKLSDSPIPDDVKRNLRPLRSAVEYMVSRSHEFGITVFLGIRYETG